VKLALVLVAVAPALAHADPGDRPWHGSVSAGGTLLLTGDDGQRGRFELEADLEPGSRFGVLVAWRQGSTSHDGLLGAGLVYEAAAARPRLVVDLHADAGADLDQRAPMLGGGIRTSILLFGPIGIALDTGGYLTIAGISGTRLAIATGAAIVAAF